MKASGHCPSIPEVNHPLPSRLKAGFIVGMVMACWLSVAAAVDVSHLRCEYRDNPLAIDVATPRLSWVIGASNSEISNSKSKIQNLSLIHI